MKCTCGIDHPDVISKDEHTRRLQAKEDANKQLREDLATASAKAKDAEEVVTLRTRIAEMTEAGTRAAAFTEHNIPEVVRKRFEIMYASDTADLDPAAKPAFPDWLKADATKADPFLAPHYGKAGTGTIAPTQPPAGTPPAAPPTQGRQPATTGTGSTEAGAAPAGKDSIKTAADLDAFQRSPTYRNMPIADQKKVDAEMAGKLGITL